jgi:NAD+ kinase
MKLRRIYIVANTTKEGSLRALAVLKAWAQLKEIETVIIDRDRPVFIETEGALVVALGGDGTVLRAASIFADSTIPILGANLGSLGFLTQVGAQSLTIALEGVLRDRFTLEDRMRLSFSTHHERGTVLNDIVITGTSKIRFCELELFWSDGAVASYPGDGLILATATGSTAYNLSAGGPVIVPPAACILASPLAVHKLGVLPVVFPADEVLRVRTNTEASLFVDGDFLTNLPAGAQITVEKAALPTQLIRMTDAPSFFKVMEEKLNWGDDSKREGKSLR